MVIRKYKCPECKQNAGVNLVYGYPSVDLAEKVERGEIALGGCAIEEGQPQRRCLACGAEWSMKKRNLDFSLLIKAVAFAATKHKKQRRKDVDASPYINHPIALADVLANEGGVLDVNVLCAAVLHDTVEDTKTTEQELIDSFGAKIASIVMEVTDDKSLDKAERKLMQIEHSAHASKEAKLVKLADKICNLRDILEHPPKNWEASRKLEYFNWAGKVVAGVRGSNVDLERIFDELLVQGHARFGN